LSNSDVRQIDDLGTETERIDGYIVDAEMPYWVGGANWQVLGTNMIYFAFKGSQCHGVANSDDGMIIWSDEGWCDPDLAWTALVNTYSQDD